MNIKNLTRGATAWSLAICAVWTSTRVQAQATPPAMEVYMDYAIFQSVEREQPFIEIYTRVNTQTLQWEEKQEGGEHFYRGEVALYTEVKDTTGNIVFTDASRIPGPFFSERDTIIPQILDAQRIPLQNGWYDIRIRVVDFNNTTSEISGSGRIQVQKSFHEAEISSISLLERYEPTSDAGPFVKSGHRLIPLVPAGAHYYPEEVNTLQYYFESYFTDRDPRLNNRYLLKTFIATENNFIINTFSKFELNDVNTAKPTLGTFPIGDLPSGQYYLVAQISNDQGEVVAEQKRFFRRDNPSADLNTAEPEAITALNTFAQKFTQADTLIDCINSLYPISSIPERGQADRVIAMGDLEIMQKFFYGFWANHNAFEPERAWLDYSKKVAFVNKKYSTRLRKGYNSDRGRVYLQYGPPNDIDGRPYEPSAYPYEIWRYYTLQPNNQRNVIFVFVNKELSTNAYELLHSTAQGEIVNYRWQMELYERTQADHNPDRDDPLDHFGSSVNDNIILGPR